MKRKIQLIALFLAVIFSLSLLTFALAAAPETNPALLISSKISDELLEEFQLTERGSATAIVWLSDIDLSSAEAAGQEAMLRMEEKRGLSDATPVEQKEEDVDIATVQAYIRAKRNAAAKLYTAYNQKLAAELFRKEDVVYISRYSPVVLVNLTQSSAVELASCTVVESIGLYQETILPESESANDGDSGVSLSEINQITRASTIHNSAAYGYTGAGVVIGMIETALPSEYYFDDSVELICDPNGVEDLFSNHAEITLTILTSIAPDATYYATSLGNANQNETFMAKIEWLLQQDVNIINSSHVQGTDGFNNYGTMSEWLDHIAYQHDVHFVQASGNFYAGDTQNGDTGVVSGGMAYNVITVGNLNPRGTTALTDDVLYATSSYYNGSSLAYKPDLCAPGTKIMTTFDPTGETSSGTSAAAPQVAAAIALLCEQRPALLTLQNTVKAILTASVNFSSPHLYVPGTDDYKMYGAGLLDCVGACWVTSAYRYAASNYPASTASKTHTFTVGASDTRIRVSLAWNIRSVGSGTNHSTITPGEITDLDIVVKDPSGNTVAFSRTSNNNVEIVDFVPTMTGTYSIVITRANSFAETVYYGLAWR